MFPNPPALADLNFVTHRHGRPVTRAFRRRAGGLGFPGLRFHDLRGTHETLLLDRGVPVHVVAVRSTRVSRCAQNVRPLLLWNAPRKRCAPPLSMQKKAEPQK